MTVLARWPASNDYTIMSSTSRSPDRASIQQAVMKALQTKNVSITGLDGSVYRSFRCQPTSDFFYVLRCRPASHTKMLRREEDRLLSEASTLSALQGRADNLVPRLIEYTATTASIGSPYLISGPFRGAILSDIEPQLSAQHLQHIDQSRGQFVCQLSKVTGPAFGPIRSNTSSTVSVPWSRCFATLLEAVLRDAEDALISIPYDFVRDQVRRHRVVLDQITTPKLTVLEMCADKNTVVDTSDWMISGFLDFSSVIWGDPYMSDCFYQPMVSFLQGFGRKPNGSPEELIRQYLYTLYHSLLAVVKCCYRPDEATNEMAARKDLMDALNRLRTAARGT